MVCGTIIHQPKDHSGEKIEPFNRELDHQRDQQLLHYWSNNSYYVLQEINQNFSFPLTLISGERCALYCYFLFLYCHYWKTLNRVSEINWNGGMKWELNDATWWWYISGICLCNYCCMSLSVHACAAWPHKSSPYYSFHMKKTLGSCVTNNCNHTKTKNYTISSHGPDLYFHDLNSCLVELVYNVAEMLAIKLWTLLFTLLHNFLMLVIIAWWCHWCVHYILHSLLSSFRHFAWIPSTMIILSSHVFMQAWILKADSYRSLSSTLNIRIKCTHSL